MLKCLYKELGKNMRISSISTYQSNPTYKAVNQKYLKQAVEKFNRCAPYHDQGHLLTCIDLAEAYGLISSRDAIDTLEAIKPYAQNALEVINGMIEQIKGNLNDSISQ